jgi:alcohol dehydrogenase class IV
MNFEYTSPTRIVFGAGVLNEVGGVVKGFGHRALIVTGRDQQRATRLLQLLCEQGVATAIFSVTGEPELATVTDGVDLARREGVEMVIGFGGGSALDTAKAIAAMLANDGELLDYVEIIGRGQALTKQSVPFIAIPTTAGTGSEVTRNAVLASPEQKVKVSLRSPLMLSRVAIVDPELTYDLSPAVTASTGMDALTQLIEPYVCLRANPMTDELCIESIPRVARSLRVAATDGGNKQAREEMSLASLHGGLALANAGLGAVHGLAGPIGGMFPAPHGATCAALLPHVMAANVQALRARAAEHVALQRYEDIAKWLTGRGDATAGAGIDWVRALVRDLKIPRLGTYGISTSSVPGIVEKAAQSSSLKANPIALTERELADAVREAI